MSTDDMEHALICDGGLPIEESMMRAREVFQELKGRVCEAFGVSCDFDFGIELRQCQGFESVVKESWDDEDSEALNMLIVELYRVRADCRSKVGVRLSFALHEAVIGALQRCVNVGCRRGVFSQN